DHTAVFGLFVVTAKQIGDGPDERGKRGLVHGWRAYPLSLSWPYRGRRKVHSPVDAAVAGKSRAGNCETVRQVAVGRNIGNVAPRASTLPVCAISICAHS